MDKFTIDRSEWLNGRTLKANSPDHYNEESFSCLLAKSGAKCCLGFYSLALGYSEEEILEMPTPVGIYYAKNSSKYLGWEVKSNLHPYGEDYFPTPLTRRLIEVNDNKLLSDQKREELIAALFLQQGITVEFVGEYK